MQTSIIACILFCFVTDALAWDGQRKGFILGFGLGPGLTSFTQTVEYKGMRETSDRENEFGLQTDFKIGYAPNNFLQIYWMSKVSWFIAHGVAGLGISYYFKPESPSPYLTGGLGYSSWTTPFEVGAEAWYGPGLSVGVGYEFFRHWSAEVNLSWGKPEEKFFGISLNVLSVRFTVHYLCTLTTE